jgi:hypothetical protein
MAEQSASTRHSGDFAVTRASGGEVLPQAAAATDTAAVKNAFKTPSSPKEGGAAARTVEVRWRRGWITLEKYPVGDDRALPGADSQDKGPLLSTHSLRV